jgi:hypothetical protein
VASGVLTTEATNERCDVFEGGEIREVVDGLFEDTWFGGLPELRDDLGEVEWVGGVSLGRLPEVLEHGSVVELDLGASCTSGE